MPTTSPLNIKGNLKPASHILPKQATWYKATHSTLQPPMASNAPPCQADHDNWCFSHWPISKPIYSHCPLTYCSSAPQQCLPISSPQLLHQPVLWSSKWGPHQQAEQQWQHSLYHPQNIQKSRKIIYTINTIHCSQQLCQYSSNTLFCHTSLTPHSLPLHCQKFSCPSAP